MNAIPHWVPMLGDINNSQYNNPVRVHSEEFGNSANIPIITEIIVGEERGIPGNVEQKVHDIFFSDYPEFTFNVSFSCGAYNPLMPASGTYTDPHSVWFNVFFGYYEIDAPLSTWDRPFGYMEKDGELVPNNDEIIRLGKADWNYFSNYMYGVPEEYIEPHNALDYDEIKVLDPSAREKIGDKYWDAVGMDDVEVVTAYTSGRDGRELESHDPLFTPIWRLSYANPHPSGDYDESFFPVRMDARFYMSYKIEYDEDYGEMVYKTYFFGGTKNNLYPDEAANRRFLAEQLEAVKQTITTHYPDLGFDEE